MSVTAKGLVNAVFAKDTIITEYTVPASKSAIIDKFTATNTDASSRTITIYLVPSGGTSDSTNQIIKTKAIAAAATQDFSELQNQILSTGDSIRVVASVADVVNIRVSGREVT